MLHKIVNEPFGLQYELKETKIETKLFYAFAAMFETLDAIQIEEFTAKDQIRDEFISGCYIMVVQRAQ